MKKNCKSKRAAKVFFEYYSRPFYLLQSELKRTGYSFHTVSATRSSFWKIVPDEALSSERSRDTILTYAKVVERDLRVILEARSIAYWLHLFRRIGPGAIGADKNPATISTTRRVLEAAAQKYSQLSLCEAIGPSTPGNLQKVFSGLLSAPDFTLEREALMRADPQFVLLAFTSDNLRQFYELEKLAYEIWFCGALLRIVGKGAKLRRIDGDECVTDTRSDELNFLVRNYDQRAGSGSVSSKAVAYGDPSRQGDLLMLPAWNSSDERIERSNAFAEKVLGLRLSPNFRPNFILAPFEIGKFFRAHLKFADAFAQQNGVSYQGYFVALTALAWRLADLWRKTDGDYFVRDIQRAYHTGLSRADIIGEIRYYQGTANRILGLSYFSTDVELAAIFDCLTLNFEGRKRWNILNSVDHALIVPCSSGKYFLDYAGIHVTLTYLFRFLKIKDERFKGDYLEAQFLGTPSVLPRGQCENKLRENRQIDYAIDAGDTVIVLECKAVSWSTAFDLGEPTALALRQRTVVEAGLNQADEKAAWLAANPVGRNFDLSRFANILPIAVSPFAEYIATRKWKYWLTENIPRVLMPEEVLRFVRVGKLKNVLNKVPISKTSSLEHSDVRSTGGRQASASSSVGSGWQAGRRNGRFESCNQ
jgi:hypothetical protein